MAHRHGLTLRAGLLSTALLALTACEDGIDFDLRNNFGNAPDTSGAARQASAPRPAADNRGVISYPNYQVAVANRGDTVADVAARIGLGAGELANFNGIAPDVPLREGEILALPRRVDEPSPATGAVTTGPIQPADTIDISTLAEGAIQKAGPQPAQVAPPPAAGTGAEPVRHKVERGETAYSISRLYNVSVRSLADWNGLGPDLSVRAGQFLLIPVPDAAAAPAGVVKVTRPGKGSPSPAPPSSTKPLPAEDVAAKPAETPAAPDLGTQRTAASGAPKMLFPAAGKIIRPYTKTSNGIDIAAGAGSAVNAADAGTVAAITQSTERAHVLILRHGGGLLTVYSNVTGITVKKGDKVKRGQKIAVVPAGDPAFVHFEVRKGLESTDPMAFLN